MTSSLPQHPPILLLYPVNAMYIFYLKHPTSIMDVISTVVEQMLCSSTPYILACVLSGIILLSRPGNRFLISIEFFFKCHGPSILLYPIRTINRALASPEDRQVQIEQINEWKAIVEKYYQIQQQELRLLDQRDILDERRNPTGSLSPVEEAEYQTIKMQLTKIRPELWENGQAFSRLQERLVVGSWTMAFCYQTDEEIWQEGQLDCEWKLGCCARSCGCCTRPRQGRNGRLQLLDPWVETHCTIACSCYENWRNFDQINDFCKSGTA